MPIDYDAIKSWRIEPKDHSFTARDTMLYALGLGLGGDESRTEDLSFVYERGLQALPSFAGVLGYPGFWLQDPATGIDWKRILNGEQGLVLHRPLPPEGRVIGRTRIEEVVDKGADKGAVIYTVRDVVDAGTGDLIATVTNSIFARGDGGFGGPASSGIRVLPPPPETQPDHVVDHPTIPQAALIYRLSGDYNPLHADPAVARAAGFPRPILHGAATWGIAAYALLRTLCGGSPARFRRFDCRFSAPVYPGETIRTEIWSTKPGAAAFRCRAVERDVVILNNGIFAFNAG